MPSQSSGPLTTVLMFVPLVAVPAIAVFGLPEMKQFKSLVERSENAPTLGKTGDSEQMLDQSTDDLVSPVVNDMRRSDTKETSARGPAEPRNEDVKQTLNSRSRASSNRGMFDADNPDSKDWSPPPRVLNDWNVTTTDGEPAGDNPPARKDSPKGDFDPDNALASNDKHEEDSPFKPLEDLAGNDSADHKSESKSSDKTSRETPKQSAHGDRSHNVAETSERTERREDIAKSEAHDDLFGDKPAAKDSKPHAKDEKPAKNGSDETLTLKSAVKRLQALGVRDYHLQPAGRQGDFHFSCSYPMPNQPRVTRRFEAEAAEPLQAVRDVLDQVESMSRK